MNGPTNIPSLSRPMIDPFGRSISYLRVSVTDRCDLRCFYCMSEDMTFLPKADLLSLEELDRLCSAFIAKGVRKLRLTGGEPLVRRNVMSLVRSLSRHLASGALHELTMTTNATQLSRFAHELADCGIRRINVSLDTLDAAKFRAITRWGELDKVLAGIEAARAAGLAVKINTVALKNLNEDEIPSLLRWAHGNGMALTLIEVMPMGEIGAGRIDQYVPLSLVRARLGREFTLTDIDDNTGGPARYVSVGETGGKLGFITPMTHNFCEVVQPGADHLHRHVAHLPRPGRCLRFAQTAARVGRRRTAVGRDRPRHRAEAEGTRLHHRPPPQPAERQPAHERDRRLAARGQKPRGFTKLAQRFDPASICPFSD